MTSDVTRTGGQGERDIEQAINALKKGAYLLKYGRRGKPKFCPFRLANDESVLIWFSGKEEKHLKLSHVSRIVSGQRTVENLTRKAQLQELELERISKQLKEAITIAGEETAKCKAAKEVIKSLTAQLKEMSETTNRNGSRMKESDSRNDNEWVEQDEPGVYITLTSLPGGAKDLKRVRFSRKRFSEKQAEQWWAENRARVYEQYNVRMVDKSSVGVASEITN